MRRYLSLLWAFINLDAKVHLEYRANFVGSLLLYISQILLLILFVEVIFSRVDSLQGWTKYEVLLLSGFFRLLLVVFNILFHRSINYIPRTIHSGDLDLLLIKPINSQFDLSLRLVAVREIADLVPATFLILYALANLSNLSWSLVDVVMILLALISGLVIFYSLYFSIAMLTIWVGRFFSFTSIFRIITEPLGIPLDLMGSKVYSFLTYVIPLAFIVTIPVRVFLHREPVFMLLVGGAVAMGCLLFSVWFWKLALKHYTSASS